MEIITKIKRECRSLKKRLVKSDKNIFERYQEEVSAFKKSNVKAFNFWSNLKKPKDLWFYEFINHNLPGHYDLNNPITFFSVYGQREKMEINNDRPHVFFTGENLDLYPDYQDNVVNQVDLSLGLEYVTAENYLRLPFWIMYFVNPKADLKEVHNSLYRLSHYQYDFSKQRKFCTLISSHDKNGIRSKICHTVDKFGEIDYAGAFRNNTKDLHKRYHNSKQYFLTLYKFNICPENSNKNGYVTEKLFEAINSGCIPVYWGSDNKPEPNVLNHDAILFYQENDTKLGSQIAELNSNPKLYEEFVCQKRLLPTAAEYVCDTIEELKSKLKEIKRNY